MIVKHRFATHAVANNTTTLILGTFNPDNSSNIDFFYGRPRNHLWDLLPACFGEQGLKSASLQAKQEFMARHKIDFVDLIKSLKDLPLDEIDNYEDVFIDKYIDEFEDVASLIASIPSISKVCFTRSTLPASIPRIGQRVRELQHYCVSKQVNFDFLITPSRFVSRAKLNNWKSKIGIYAPK